MFIAVYYPPRILSLSSHLLSLIIRCVPHIYDIGFLCSYRNLHVLLLNIVTLHLFKVSYSKTN